jgi:hypothetical protein
VSNAVKTTMEELDFGAASEVKTSIEKGAAFDVAILTPAALDALVEEGKSVLSEGPTSRAAFGMLVRKGAPKPDIRSLRHSSRRCWKPNRSPMGAGAGAPYLKSLFERRGSLTRSSPTQAPTDHLSDSQCRSQRRGGAWHYSDRRKLRTRKCRKSGQETVDAREWIK